VTLLVAAALLAALMPGVPRTALAAAAAAGGTATATPLDHYLDGLTSLRADFTQSMTDAHGTALESGSGSFALQRPGHFRWDYEPHTPAGADAADSADATTAADQGGLLLVADGDNLWYYDRELAQVTVKPLQASLSTTPIMLLTGSAAALGRDFDVTTNGSQDGLSWVLVKPRSEQADFSDARLGFDGQTLVRMVFHDMLGQTVRLEFSHSQRNVRLDPSTFQFKVPPGVDVIGTPQGASGSR
jgi:outer membrane lipoprotein carrier protein